MKRKYKILFGGLCLIVVGILVGKELLSDKNKSGSEKSDKEYNGSEITVIKQNEDGEIVDVNAHYEVEHNGDTSYDSADFTVIKETEDGEELKEYTYYELNPELEGDSEPLTVIKETYEVNPDGSTEVYE